MKNEIKATLKLAWPIILGQLGQMLFGVMDNAMVGRLGAVPLAASGFANTVIAIPLCFLIGVSSSISVMAAQAIGRNHAHESGRYCLAGIAVLLILILSLMIFYLFGPDFLPFFEQPDEVLQASRSYFGLVAWSLIPMVLFQGFRQFSVGLEKAFVPTLILGFGLVINFCLNYTLIYGSFGAPALGLDGAGWATLVSRIFIFVALFIFIYRSSKFEKFRVPINLSSFGKKHLKPVLKIGLTSGFQYLFEIGAFTAAGFMAGWVGTKALAAHLIALNVGAITFMVAWGLSFAVSVRVGQAFGEGDLAKARARGTSALFSILCIMGFFGICLVFLRHLIPELYIKDVEVIELATHLLLICAVFQVFDGLQCVAIGALRGLGDVTFPSIATFIIYWGVCVPTSYYLAFVQNKGVQGLWWGLTLGLALAALVLIKRFRIIAKA